MSGRPLVVLAGWLGCQPRHLRRYQALYEKLGIQSTITIATPRMVVESTFRQPICPTRVPIQHQHWTSSTMNHDDTNNKIEASHENSNIGSLQTTHDLAWSVLRQVHESQSPYFFFHSFSNGGCFLWEEIQNILNASIEVAESNNIKHSDQQQQHPHDEFTNIRELRDKLAGVVFDSSPAALDGQQQAGLGPLYRALEYCNWQERWPLLLKIQTKTWFQPNFVEQARHRARTFYDGMREDPWSLPQLYLYSEDDALTMFAPLEELVRHRRQLFGSELISFQRWKSSPHCAHFLQHPQDYERAVTDFVAKCQRADSSGSYKMISKL